MKFVIATVRINQDPAQDRFIYPAVWKAREVDRFKKGPLVYDGLREEKDPAEVLVCFRDDAVADRYIADPDCREVTQADADLWLQTNGDLAGQPEERVTDSNRLTAIIAKKMAGQTFSQEDLDALDPDKPVEGIKRRLKTTAGIFGV